MAYMCVHVVCVCRRQVSVEGSPCVHGVPDDVTGDGWGLADFDEDGVAVGPVSRSESVDVFSHLLAFIPSLGTCVCVFVCLFVCVLRPNNHSSGVANSFSWSRRQCS